MSYNNLEGMVPTKGIFKNATATSVEGNSKLCDGIPEFQLLRCKFPHPRRGALTKTLKWMISLICGILGVTLAVSILYNFVLQRENKEIWDYEYFCISQERGYKPYMYNYCPHI
ncbi:putative non-specific serine/threonine protein kinase [Rosa chinensis]|uniref:Putative non-specific serine/threonine protein kinase n=1 Tax=Rosa chinensis TaxID=74649 RepID=A0A2P6SEG0_ROSCH|nr:putative non-specific serine/threonine protein kinase [Rosa chinensis]